MRFSFADIMAAALATTAITSLLSLTPPAAAEQLLGSGAFDRCLLEAARAAPQDTPISELRTQCASSQETPAGSSVEQDESGGASTAGASLLGQRMARDRVAAGIGSLLTPHRRNYVLPISYMHSPNQAPFAGTLTDDDGSEALDNIEAKFQLSIKTTLAEDLFVAGDGLQFGFTTISFWQAYNSKVSAPFRETNYEPEIFYGTALPWRPFEVEATAFVLGLSHQSNGRSGELSRSWNRLYANLIWEQGDFVLSFKPWWRIPETSKTGALSAGGDDNPDIEKYMGHFELTTIYQRKQHEFSLLLRNNLRSDNRGAIQLDWTFPLWKRFRGYVQVFSGYGESLIDYDARIQRVGIGILLTDLLGAQ